MTDLNDFIKELQDHRKDDVIEEQQIEKKEKKRIPFDKTIADIILKKHKNRTNIAAEFLATFNNVTTVMFDSTHALIYVKGIGLDTLEKYDLAQKEWVT